MKILVACVAVFLSMICFRSANAQLAAAPISLEVRTNKTSYAIGEPIYLTYTVRNTTQQFHLLLNADPFAVIPQILRIKAPSGELLMSLGEQPHGELNQPPVTLALRSNSFFGVDVDLLEEYPELYPMVNPHNFDAPGTYEIVGVYSNDREYDDEKKGTTARKLWTGKITSKPIMIEVKAPSAAEIASLGEVLRVGSADKKLRAIELIRKAKITQLTNTILPFLAPVYPAEMRRETAQALYEMPDAKYYDVYLSNLKANDADVRGYMALILGDKLKSKQAVPALVEVADPEKYPESYRAAARALIQIGDPQAIPALRKIAESDPSPEIKKYVRDNLQKLEALQTKQPAQ